MPWAADMPTMPWCSTERSSRIGRKISTPSIRMISSAPSAIAPDSTRHAPERQCRGRTAGNRAVGDAARQHVGAQHPHGALEQIARLDFQLVGARLALPERLERGQTLDRIQELGRERGIGLLAAERVGDVELVPQRRREQRQQREDHHHAATGKSMKATATKISSGVSSAIRNCGRNWPK